MSEPRKRTRPKFKVNRPNEGHFGGAVGKNNPPKHSQFQPGRSGNLNGRPKGTKNIHTMVKAELKSLTSVLENGERVTKQPLEIVLIQLRQKAMKGEDRAAKLYFEIMARHGDFEDCDEKADALTPREKAVLMKLFPSWGKENGGSDA